MFSSPVKQPYDRCSYFLSLQVPELWHGNPLVDGIVIEEWVEKEKAKALNITDVVSRARELTRLEAILNCVYNEQAKVSQEAQERLAQATSSEERWDIVDEIVRQEMEPVLGERFNERLVRLRREEREKKRQNMNRVSQWFWGIVANVFPPSQVDDAHEKFFNMPRDKRSKIMRLMTNVWTNRTFAEFRKVLIMLGLGYGAYKGYTLYNDQLERKLQVVLVNKSTIKKLAGVAVGVVIQVMKPYVKEGDVVQGTLREDGKRYRTYILNYVVPKTLNLETFQCDLLKKMQEKRLSDVKYAVPSAFAEIDGRTQLTIPLVKTPIKAPKCEAKQAPNMYTSFIDFDGSPVSQKCKVTMCGLGLKDRKSTFKYIQNMKRQYVEGEGVVVMEKNPWYRAIINCMHESEFCEEPEPPLLDMSANYPDDVVEVSLGSVTHCYVRTQLRSLREYPAPWYGVKKDDEEDGKEDGEEDGKVDPKKPIYRLSPFNVYFVEPDLKSLLKSRLRKFKLVKPTKMRATNKSGQARTLQVYQLVPNYK